MVTNDQRLCCWHTSTAFCSAKTLLLHGIAQMLLFAPGKALLCSLLMLLQKDLQGLKGLHRSSALVLRTSEDICATEWAQLQAC